MTPILPYVEQEVKFVGDLQYLFQSPEYKNGLVPNLFSPCAGLDAVFLLLTHDKNVHCIGRLHNRVPGDGQRIACFLYGNSLGIKTV